MASPTGPTLESLGALKYKSLQVLAKSCGIRANLSKEKLIENLLKAQETLTNTTNDSVVTATYSTYDSTDETEDTPPKDTPPEDTRGILGCLGPTANTYGEHEQDPRYSTNESNDELQGGKTHQPPQLMELDFNNDLRVKLTDAPPYGGNLVKRKDDQHHKNTVVAKKESAPETKIQKPAGRRDPDMRKQSRCERLIASTESQVVGGSWRISKQPRFANKLPTTGAPSSRFDSAHQHIFDSQPSIERYGKTPMKTGVKYSTPAGRSAVSAVKATPNEVKSATKVHPETPAAAVMALVDSGINSVKNGVTVASKPCSLVVQPSTKKPTQVKEFRLSTKNRKREGFTFKPYTGPVRPLTAAAAASAGKTPYFNIGRSDRSVRGAPKASQNSHQSIEPIGIKDKLASGRAQAARRAAHARSGKLWREKKISLARVGCT